MNVKYLVWGGKVTTVKCTKHVYSWSGQVPCTGVYRCVLCGEPAPKEKVMELHTNDCVQCGFCCKQGPCQFGKWDENKHQCMHLTKDNKCSQYDFIKECGLGWEHNPAFGFGCSSSLNSDRQKILRRG